MTILKLGEGVTLWSFARALGLKIENNQLVFYTDGRRVTIGKTDGNQICIFWRLSKQTALWLYLVLGLPSVSRLYTLQPH